MSHSPVQMLLGLLDSSFHRRSWHGPNLRGSLRGLTPAQAVWRPRPDRHNIAEQVLHAAYWKYVVRRRLNSEKRGSFIREGSNWFAVSELTNSEWKKLVKLLESEHALLRAAVARLAPAVLPRKPAGSKVDNYTIVTGIAAHDVYHAGQIQLIKRMQKA